MIDLINYLKRLVIGFLARFAARSGDSKILSFNFGNSKQMLVQGKGMMFRNKIPMLDASRMEWARRRRPVRIFPEREPNPHMVISGMSGFGKSTLFKSLIRDIRSAGVSCVIFDAHDEHSDAVRRMGGDVHSAMHSGINILELDGASVSERISELSRMFKEVYSLGYIQATKLSECLWYTYRKCGASGRNSRSLRSTPTMRDLLNELNIFMGNARSAGERNTLSHLRDRLSLLNSSAFAGQSINTEGIEKGLHSFSLGGMKSREARIIYIGELLGRIYARMHDGQRSRRIKLYIMVDEAQFLVDESASSSVITKMVEEGRKYGIGVIIVTHAACTLNRKIMANCASFATFYAREPSELNYVAKVLCGGNPDSVDPLRKRVGSLGLNEVILVSGNSREPTVVSTPKFGDLEDMYASCEPSESELLAFLRSRAGRPIMLGELERAGVRAGRDSIDRLVGSGVLDSFVFDKNDGREEWIMLHNGSISIGHEVHVRKMADMLDSMGLSARIIDNSNGPDLSCSINGSKVAIEYETGSKSSESTRRMLELRLESYDIVVVVANGLSLEKYARDFGSERVIVTSFEGARELLAGL